MSLTLLYRSNKARFIYSPTKSQIMVVIIAVCGLVLISSRSTDLPSENNARLKFAQTGFKQQSFELESLKATTEQRLSGMMLKLAEMDSQVQRLDALGAHLVEQAKLNPKEFNFNQSPLKDDLQTSDNVDVIVNDELIVKMDSMLEQLKDKTLQLNALESLMMNHHIEEQSRLTGRPVVGGWLSSHYGIRKDPFSGLPAMHKGLDFAGKEDDPVTATGAGIVVWAGRYYGYGELVEIDHGDGLVTRYGHNKQLNVKIGDVVTKGQEIALMGNTGRSTGAHVHYEVLRKGKQLDPLPFVYRD
ncbi:MAG: murein DD-endopeptidase MepM/ murein hydrolase activator NlpD [Paraglaciecola sp.]